MHILESGAPAAASPIVPFDSVHGTDGKALLRSLTDFVELAILLLVFNCMPKKQVVHFADSF